MTIAEKIAEVLEVSSTDVRVSSFGGDVMEVKINGKDPTPEEQDRIDRITDPKKDMEHRIKQEVRSRIADMIANAGDLSNPAERKKLADEIRKEEKRKKNE